jgi:Transmembrane amino acid transporter protein
LKQLLHIYHTIASYGSINDAFLLEDGGVIPDEEEEEEVDPLLRPIETGHSEEFLSKSCSRGGPYQQVYQFLLDGTEDEEGNGRPQSSSASLRPTSRKTAVPIGAVANLCNAMLGAGVLALPYAIYQMGILAGGTLLIVAGLATYASIAILSQCLSYYNAKHPHEGWTTYEALTEGVLKQHYRQLVEVSLLIFCCGCAVAYLIAVGDISKQAGLLLFGGSRSWTLILVWSLVMMPLSMLQHLNSIAGASAIGVLAVGTLVFATAIHVLTTPSISSRSTNPPPLIHWTDLLFPANGWISVLTACPVILFAFSCQANVCAIYDELPTMNNNNTTHPNVANRDRPREQANNHKNDDPASLSTRQTMMNGVTAWSVAVSTSVSVYLSCRILDPRYCPICC